MNRTYHKEEKQKLIAGCKDWMANGKRVSTFAKEKGILFGTVYCW